MSEGVRTRKTHSSSYGYNLNPVERRIQTIIAWTLLIGVVGSLATIVGLKIREGQRKLDTPENSVLPTVPETRQAAPEAASGWSAIGVTYPFRSAMIASKLTSAVMPHSLYLGKQVKAREVLLILDKSYPTNQLEELTLNKAMQQEELTDARADLSRSELLYKDRKLSPISAQRLRKDRLRVRRAELKIRMLTTQIKRQHLTLRDYQVISPFDGVISKLHCEVGESVMPRTPLVRIIQLDPIKIRFHLEASQRIVLKQGDAFIVRCRALPDYRGLARVHEILPEARSGSRRFQAILTLPNPPQHKQRLWPGMAVEVRPATAAEVTSLAPAGD